MSRDGEIEGELDEYICVTAVITSLPLNEMPRDG